MFLTCSGDILQVLLKLSPVYVIDEPDYFTKLCSDQIIKSLILTFRRFGTKTKTMKKQIKKLNLSKSTISNLGTPEMSKIVGGVKRTYSCVITEYCTKGRTCNANCNGG